MAHPCAVILGPGLIGGSLALALRDAGAFGSVRLWGRNPESVAAAKTAGLDTFTNLQEAVTPADVIVFCLPVNVIPSLARETAAFAKATARVTDAGSTKRGIVEELEKIFQGRFIGSHPMAGSEKTGFAAADARLFENAACIVTPTPTTEDQTLVMAESLWKAVGGISHRMSPEEHDRLVARISHLPHVTASALVQLASTISGEAQEFSGGGYRDTTRIAAGSPDLWTGILQENRDEVVSGLDDLIILLQEVRSLLAAHQTEHLYEFLLRAKTQRDRLISDQNV